MQPPEQTGFTGSIASLDKIDAYKKTIVRLGFCPRALSLNI
jgi:hypothetical protein